MTNAAARAVGTYTSTGRYSDVLTSILPSNIDKKEWLTEAPVFMPGKWEAYRVGIAT